ncbi:MAG: hypothetical protein V1918_04755 [Planctomycetota bacterium]
METRIRRWQWLLRHPAAWIPIGALELYLLAIQVLPWLIDTRAVRRNVVAYASHCLDTDVSIEGLDLDLRTFGGWLIRLRNIRVKNPSPDFGLDRDLLMIRKATQEDSFAHLFQGVCRPRILLKDWQLALQFSEGGRLNLSEILSNPGTGRLSDRPWPFSRIFAHPQDLILQNGRIRLSQESSGVETWRLETGLLQGTARYEPASSSRAGMALEVSGPLDSQSKGTLFHAGVLIKPSTAKEGRRIGSWETNIQADQIPLILLERLLGLPPFPPDAVAGYGSLTLGGSIGEANTWSVQTLLLETEGVSVPVLNIKSPVIFTVKRVEPTAASLTGTVLAETYNFSILESRGTKTLRGTFRTTPEGLALQFFSSALDLTNLPLCSQAGSAEQAVFQRLGSLEGIVKSAHLFGLDIRDCQIRSMLSDGQIKRFELNGTLAGGLFSLAAEQWIPQGVSLPRSLFVSIRHAEAAVLAEATAHLPGRMFRLQPSDGRISGFVLRQPAPSPDASWEEGLNPSPTAPGDAGVPGEIREGWYVNASIEEEVRFDEPAENPILKALWQVPLRLSETAQRLFPLETARGLAPSLAPLTSLCVEKGEIALGGDGRGVFSLLGDFQTRELGRILLWSEPGANREEVQFRVALHPEGLSPESGGMFSTLPPPFLRVLNDAAEEGGLRIAFVLSRDTARVTEEYVADVEKRVRESPSHKER